MPSASSSEFVRRALLRIDPATVLAAVDSLDLRANAKVSAVVGVPLRGLVQRRDVAAFAVNAPALAALALVEVLAEGPLERVIDELGEHVEHPTFEQLSAAVDAVLASGATTDEVVAVLAYAIGEELPAAAHCERLLDEREQFRLPALPEASRRPSLLTPKEVDPEVRAQRRARRERAKRTSAAPTRPSRPVTAKPPRAVTHAEGVVRSGEVPVIERRPLLLTPAELSQFDPAHPLAGTVVMVDVPFDATDPVTPETTKKERPALVVAASESAILVRAIFSNPHATRVVFRPWRRLHLDHVSYVDGHRTAVVVARPDALRRIGRLTTEEWNALF